MSRITDLATKEAVRRLQSEPRDKVPVGTAMLNLRTDVPEGWISLAVVSEIEQSDYPELAQVMQRAGVPSTSNRLVLPALTAVNGFNWILKVR